MKKAVSLLLVFLLIIGTCNFAYSEGQISVLLNGSEITFDQPPVIVNDRTLVPLRAIFESMGAEVEWEDATQTVTSTLGDTKIQLSIGDNILYKNGNAKVLDVPAMLINDRTLVPVRAIAESFGAKVDWTEETSTVTIKTYDYSKILNGDFSDFVGVWQNGEGYTIELDEYGEKSDPVIDGDNVYFWKACDFYYEHSYYWWGEVVDMGDWGDSYGITLIPIGVEIFDYHTNEIITSDTTQIRLYAGQDFCPTESNIYYPLK